MIVQKNRDFQLYFVDEASGYGVIHSQKDHRCLFLNPLATVIWKLTGEFIDINETCLAFIQVFNNIGGKEYFLSVINELIDSRVLLKEGNSNELPKDLRKEEFPLKQLYLYVTKNCNARCYHCYQPIKKVNGFQKSNDCEELTKESLLKIINEAIPLGLKNVKISGGEPFLRNDICEIITKIHEKGVQVAIETNGFFIDDPIAETLSKANVDVSISLDGGSAEIHDRLRGLPGSFERVINSLQKLCHYGCHPKIIMAISRANVSELEEVIRVASTNGCRHIKLNPVNTIGIAKRLDNKDILLTVEEILTLYQKRKDLELKYKVFLFLEGPPAFSSFDAIVDGHCGICPFMEIMGVLADGSISLCGIGNSYPNLVVGKLNGDGTTIESLWNEGRLFKALRTLRDKKIGGVCGACIFESYCKGSCRAYAYGEYSSFEAPHPWCQTAYERGMFPSQYLKKTAEDT